MDEKDLQVEFDRALKAQIGELVASVIRAEVVVAELRRQLDAQKPPEDAKE